VIERDITKANPKCQTGFSDKNEVIIVVIPIIQRNLGKKIMAESRDDIAPSSGMNTGQYPSAVYLYFKGLKVGSFFKRVLKV
jgi:hypothetical protein